MNALARTTQAVRASRGCRGNHSLPPTHNEPLTSGYCWRCAVETRPAFDLLPVERRRLVVELEAEGRFRPEPEEVEDGAGS